MKPPYKNFSKSLTRNGEKLDKEMTFFVLTLEKLGAKVLHAQQDDSFHIMFETQYKTAVKITKASRVFNVEVFDKNIWILILRKIDNDDLARASVEWEKAFGKVTIDKCECITCRLGVEAVAKQEEEALKTHGWYAHFVTDKSCPYGIDTHTHGFGYLFHPDIQICLYADPKTIHSFFALLYDKIKNGEKFTTDKKYKNILINNFDVTFIQINENLIRMIIPDENNNLDPKTMSSKFAKQYKV